MKKIGMITTLALVSSLFLMSCKRDFTCTCQSTDALGNTSTQMYDLNDQTRADAIENCENYETDNAWQTRTCNL